MLAIELKRNGMERGCLFHFLFCFVFTRLKFPSLSLDRFARASALGVYSIQYAKYFIQHCLKWSHRLFIRHTWSFVHLFKAVLAGERVSFVFLWQLINRRVFFYLIHATSSDQIIVYFCRHSLTLLSEFTWAQFNVQWMEYSRWNILILLFELYFYTH